MACSARVSSTTTERRRSTAAAPTLVLATVLAGLTGCLEAPPPEPTPLEGFEAPFVFGRFRVPADNPLTEEGVALGRALFYDVRLSGDNRIACATCHLQSLAFTDGKARSVGGSGKLLDFSAMSLANLLWGPQRFFWDGRTTSLEEQALIPIENPDEMGQDLDDLVHELDSDADYRRMFRAAYGEVSKTNIARALASFQRTLVSSNSKYDRYLRGEAKLTGLEEQGRKLFMAHPDSKASLRGGNCIDCHSQFVTAGFSEALDGFSNNGLDGENDLPAGHSAVTGDASHRGVFKVPSLRNVALTAPYMHDGRLATLDEVMDHYNEGIRVSETLSPLILEADNLGTSTNRTRPSLNLSEQETTAIIAFLHTLTDRQFVEDERFSNPFKEDP